jgi:hypothetical protein
VGVTVGVGAVGAAVAVAVSIAAGASVEAAVTGAISSWGDSHEIRMMAARYGKQRNAFHGLTGFYSHFPCR